MRFAGDGTRAQADGRLRADPQALSRSCSASARTTRRFGSRRAFDGALNGDMELPAALPLHAPSLLAFFAARAVPGVEEVDGTTYRRSVRLPHGPGVLALELGGSAPRWRAGARRPARRGRAAARLCGDAARRGRRPAARSTRALAADPLLRELVAAAPGRRVPGLRRPGRDRRPRRARPAGQRRRRPHAGGAADRAAAASRCPSPPAPSPTCSRPRARSPRSTRRRCRCRAPAAARWSAMAAALAAGLDPRDRDAFLAPARHRPVDRRLRRDALRRPRRPARDRPRRPPRLRPDRRPRRSSSAAPRPGGPGAPTPSSTSGASHDRLRHHRQPDRGAPAHRRGRRAHPPVHVAVRRRPRLGARPGRARRARPPARASTSPASARSSSSSSRRPGPTFQRRVWDAAARDPVRRDDDLRRARARARRPAQGARGRAGQRPQPDLDRRARATA